MCVKLLPPNKKETKQNQSRLHKTPISTQWRIQDFKLGGTHLKKLRRAEEGAKNFGVLRVKNHDLTSNDHIFTNFRGGARAGCASPPPPMDPPMQLSHFGKRLYMYKYNMYNQQVNSMLIIGVTYYIQLHVNGGWVRVKTVNILKILYIFSTITVKGVNSQYVWND